MGAVAGAFPLDLCPGYVLRRIWRVVRWPFVRAFGQRVGPVAAEAIADAVDRMAVSPKVLVDPWYASIHRHPAAVPTFRSLPSGAVCGVQRGGGFPGVVACPLQGRIRFVSEPPCAAAASTAYAVLGDHFLPQRQIQTGGRVQP